jgi:hypothetical protein
MRRAPIFVGLIALAMSVAVPASAMLACMVNANATVKAQMACCKGAKPDCPQSSKALQCCKSTDHPQQQNVAKTPSAGNPILTQAAPSPFVGGANIVLPSASFSLRHAVALFAGTTSPPHLIFSALLI